MGRIRKGIEPYPPSIVSVAKPPRGLALRRGEFPALEGEHLNNLLQSTEYILVGVFDDMSKMLWERRSSASVARGESANHVK